MPRNPNIAHSVLCLEAFLYKYRAQKALKNKRHMKRTILFNETSIPIAIDAPVKLSIKSVIKNDFILLSNIHNAKGKLPKKPTAMVDITKKFKYDTLTNSENGRCFFGQS